MRNTTNLTAFLTLLRELRECPHVTPEDHSAILPVVLRELGVIHHEPAVLDLVNRLATEAALVRPAVPIATPAKAKTRT